MRINSTRTAWQRTAKRVFVLLLSLAIFCGIAFAEEIETASPEPETVTQPEIREAMPPESDHDPEPVSLVEPLPDAEAVADTEEETVGITTDTGSESDSESEETDVPTIIEGDDEPETLAPPEEGDAPVIQVAVHTITYILNNGINSEDNPTEFIEDDGITLSEPTRKGYTFGGWFTDSRFRNRITSVPAGTTKDVKVYAKWTANTYHIVFDGNGSIAGNMSEKVCTYEKTYKLPANRFTRAGYRYLGWSDTPDGAVLYRNQASVSNLCHDPDGVITLYAVWQAEEYAITYKLGGGVFAEQAPASYTIEDTVVLPEPSRRGYTFDGWYLDAKFAKSAPATIEHATGKLTVFAKWKANTYIVNFDGNGASETNYSQTIDYDKKVCLTANRFKRRGYTFKGWTSAEDSSVFYSDKMKVMNLSAENQGTVTLYARWELNTYKITYILNGGTNAPGNPSVFTVESGTQIADPTREGFSSFRAGIPIRTCVNVWRISVTANPAP